MKISRIRCAILVAAMSIACNDAASPSFARIRFSQQPGGAVAGEPLTFSIEFLDDDGERATSVNSDVTVVLGDGDDVAGARSVRAENGVATFDDFIVTAAGAHHVLSATSQGLKAISLPFTVTAAAVNAAQSTVAVVPGQTLLSNTPRSIVFTFADEYGNPISRADVTVASDVPGALLNPAGGKTTSEGTFQTNFRPPSTGTAHFSATVNARPIAIAAPLEIINACLPVPVSLPFTLSGTLIREQGCIIGGAPYELFRFTTATGGGVSMDIDAFFLATMNLRDDPAAQNVPLFALQPVNRQWLLPAGTWEFRIGAEEGQGPYTVSAKGSPANRGDTIRILAVAGTYTGQTLAAGDFINSIDSFTDSFAIYSQRPCTITVRSTAFDPFISLSNSFGIAVGFDDNSGGGTDAQITRSSCTSTGGAIRIDIASGDPGATGPYTLIVTYN